MKTFYLLGLLLIIPLVQASDREEQDQYFAQYGDFSASHILVSYKRANKAPSSVKRSKKEALAKATMLLAQLKTNPTRFAELAGAHSDGPSAKRGGRLGPFQRGDMAPSFERAVKGLKPGEIVAKPVKTSFGFHIVRRDSLLVKHFSAHALILTFKGAQRLRGIADEAFLRSKEEARQEMETLAPSISSNTFRSLLKKQGDLQKRGGFLGVFKPGDSKLTDRIIRALEPLEYGQIGPFLELPIGFVLLQRKKVRQYAASLIQIAFLEAENAPPQVQRTRKEAWTLAQEALALAKGQEPFDALAKKYSDGRFRTRGGKQSPWFSGSRDPNLESLLDRLKPMEIADAPLELASGFYIVKRDK